MDNKSGFTLVEIIVASVIFALVIAGLLSVFVAGTKHIIHARERITSAELAKVFLDPMQMDVRMDTWNQPGNDLNLSVPPVPLTAQTVNNRVFSGTYTVADGNPLGGNYDSALFGTDLRRVTTKITWNEPTP